MSTDQRGSAELDVIADRIARLPGGLHERMESLVDLLAVAPGSTRVGAETMIRRIVDGHGNSDRDCERELDQVIQYLLQPEHEGRA